jgi:hypothetical protein
MMQRYEIAILSTGVNAAAKLTPRIAAWAQSPAAGGSLVGLLLPEFGTLNQVMVLRGFATPEALAAERARTLSDADPFGCGDALTGWMPMRRCPHCRRSRLARMAGSTRSGPTR